MQLPHRFRMQCFVKQGMGLGGSHHRHRTTALPTIRAGSILSTVLEGALGSRGALLLCAG
jgi:hypothetical protein